MLEGMTSGHGGARSDATTTAANAAYPPGLEGEGSPVRQVQEEEQEEDEEFARREDTAKGKEGNVNTPSIDHANHLLFKYGSLFLLVCEYVCVCTLTPSL